MRWNDYQFLGSLSIGSGNPDYITSYSADFFFYFLLLDYVQQLVGSLCYALRMVP
jgi:hypothetical protein